jgi:hypothetical protein
MVPPTIHSPRPIRARIRTLLVSAGIVATGPLLSLGVPADPAGNRLAVRILYLGAWTAAGLATGWTALRAGRASWRFSTEP